MFRFIKVRSERAQSAASVGWDDTVFGNHARYPDRVVTKPGWKTVAVFGASAAGVAPLAADFFGHRVSLVARFPRSPLKAPPSHPISCSVTEPLAAAFCTAKIGTRFPRVLTRSPVRVFKALSHLNR